ncbi:sulfotransferase family protein [Parasphingorhabdus sp.]|uniref:sulfotransferase family protein n=1 Tax=Parasphingorhabdus sp. TaxID=2709688 RepID=UPI002B2657D5|nr:sulfotransferase [Parasphingorhabdus sp.]
MGLKVIGSGFGRTGTMSMKVALEQLGYLKTHHMEYVLKNADQRAWWHDVATGGTPDWETIFDGYQASVDFPSASYYKELLTAFPDAKVVHTVRDADRWYKSASETIYAMGQASPAWAQKFIPFVRKNKEMVNGAVWNRVFHGRFEDEAYAKQVFRDYTKQVKADIPADRLLIFEVKDGWEPLCAFLGKEVPDTDFPHVNDSASFRKMIRNIKLFFGAVHVLLAAGVMGLVWWLLA